LPSPADQKSALLQKLDARAAHYGDLSRKIWDFAEVGFQETRSAALLQSELQEAGFTVADSPERSPVWRAVRDTAAGITY